MNDTKVVDGKLLSCVLDPQRQNPDLQFDQVQSYTSLSLVSSSEATEADSVELESIAANPIALPGRIANALVNVYEGLAEFELFENHRRVLSCLIRNGVRLSNPRADIFIKKSTIATQLKVNEATVYRSLSALEEKGLIRRTPQNRAGGRLKVIGYVGLTEIALTRLGLVGATDSQPDRTIANASAIAKASELASVRDVNSEAFKQSSSKKQPGRAPFEIIDGRAIPTDLAWLHTHNSLSLSGLLKLMKVASNAGTRLSDIVACAHEAIAKLRGRELFAYLQALTTKPKDFSYVASRAREADAAAAQIAAEKAAEAASVEFVKGREGLTFDGPTGKRWTVEANGFLVRCANTGKSLGSVPFGQAMFAVTAVASGTWPRYVVDPKQVEQAESATTRERPARTGGWTSVTAQLQRRFSRALSIA